MKLLITGASGQLGLDLLKILSQDDEFEFVGLTEKDLDITRMEEVSQCISTYKPDVVVNCAAYTNVDACEDQVDTAYRVNAIGAKYLAQATYDIGAELVQISTDYVFDGQGMVSPDGRMRHYTEFDLPNPISVYGRSKLQGEVFTRTLNPKHYIIRTAWLYGDGNNFVKTMLQLASTKREIKVVNDQTGTPTSTVDLVNIILALIKSKNYGTFHGTCQGQCTWYEFAREIFRLSRMNVNVIPCTTEEFPRRAKRPKYGVLENYMLRLTIGDPARNWKEALKEYIDGLR